MPQADTDIRAGQLRIALDFLDAEMVRTALKARVEELKEMEAQHTEDYGYDCGCSAQVISSYERAHNSIVRARRESCLDCSIGEVCGRHMTL